MAESEQQRLARELEEQLKALRIEDVLMQSLVTVSSMGFRRLGLTEDSRGERDLAQSQLAIEAMEALAPVLDRFLPEQLAADFKGSASQLKLAYVRAASEGAGTASEGKAREDMDGEAADDRSEVGDPAESAAPDDAGGEDRPPDDEPA